jgi:predicted nucleic acid-binding Zn ribbon protein
MVPKRIFFTKGVGKHRERLTSFELALRDAGIAAQNLVRVSSIFPPQCKLIARSQGLKYLNPGEVVFAAGNGDLVPPRKKRQKIPGQPTDPKKPSAGMKFCTTCGSPVGPGEKFCTHCGTHLVASIPAAPQPPSVCPGCGHPLQPGEKFCSNCGYKIPGL